MAPRSRSSIIVAFILVTLFLLVLRGQRSAFHSSHGEGGLTPGGNQVDEPQQNGNEVDVHDGFTDNKHDEPKTEEEEVVGKPKDDETFYSSDGDVEQEYVPEEVTNQNDPVADDEDFYANEGLYGDKEQRPSSALNQPSTTSSVSTVMPVQTAVDDTSKPTQGVDDTTVDEGGAENNGLPVSKLQEEYEKERDDSDAHDQVDAIYNKTISMTSQYIKDLLHPEDILQSSLRLRPLETKPRIYSPYPYPHIPAWEIAQHAALVRCELPFGDTKGVSEVHVWEGLPTDYPEPSFGSYEVLDSDTELCFERQTRLGPYGYYDEATTWDESLRSANWTSIHWGYQMKRCLVKNMQRFDLGPKGASFVYPMSGPAKRGLEKRLTRPKPVELKEGQKRVLAERTAVVVRTHWKHNYTDNDMHTLRALIIELSLRTGGEYQIFLLVEVSDSSLDISSDKTLYKETLASSVPQEFRDIAHLYSFSMISKFYPLVPTAFIESPERYHLPLQRFAQLNPSFTTYWNIDLSARYTGHYYTLLTTLSAFAKTQPRKELWERNELFYIPSLHGPYDTKFRQNVSLSSANRTIWIPPTVAGTQPVGPTPSITEAADNYELGVDEEADLITLSPIFDPTKVEFAPKYDVQGYSEPNPEVQSKPQPIPRRASTGTFTRLSKNLLDALHIETTAGRHMATSLAFSTTCLHHGLKAVYAPHPIFMDRSWKAESLEKYWNAIGVDNVAGRGNEERMKGASWGYIGERNGNNSEAEKMGMPTAERLWRIWMGEEVAGIGGKEWEEKNGRICLPALLL